MRSQPCGKNGVPAGAQTDMAIIVSRRIREREFGKFIHTEDRAVLLRTARIALAAPIAGSGLPACTRLLKAYATSAQGPRRVVYLLAVEAGDLFLLFYRDKADIVGANITPRNQALKKQLAKHLVLLREDLAKGHFDSIEPEP